MAHGKKQSLKVLSMMFFLNFFLPFFKKSPHGCFASIKIGSLEKRIIILVSFTVYYKLKTSDFENKQPVLINWLTRTTSQSRVVIHVRPFL